MDMKIGLLVIDYDRTLVDSKKKLLEETKQQLINFQNKGGKVIIATSRPYSGVKDVAEELKLNEYNGYIISDNGGSITDPTNNDVLYNKVICVDDVCEVLTRLDHLDVSKGVYNNNELIIDSHTDDLNDEATSNKLDLKIDKELIFSVESPKIILSKTRETIHTYYDSVISAVSEEFEVFTSSPRYIEITKKEINKAISLEYLLDTIEYDGNIISIGDAQNDLPLFEISDLSVAMGNAQDLVKEKADIIIKSNDDDGIGIFLKNLDDDNILHLDNKNVYHFSEGNSNMKSLLGGKGANLCQMYNLDINVPEGFIISTKVCTSFYENNKEIPKEIKEEINFYLEDLQNRSGKYFGDINNPLLVSIRSGAKISMPGMMDSILNVGLNDEVAKHLSENTNNKRFTYDSYRRLIQMYGQVIYDIDLNFFEDEIELVKKNNGYSSDNDLTAEDFEILTNKFKEIFMQKTGKPFPQDIIEQIYDCVYAVFNSWNTDRAKYYRKIHDIDDSIGTAVNIMEMVFGNKSENSLTGVAFSRNPITGEHKIFGEFLTNAQGEDVVAGIRTPINIEELEVKNKKIYDEFLKIVNKLESYYKDMQDIEFTVEEGKLFILQTRNGKSTAKASIKISYDFYKEGIYSEEELIKSIDIKQIKNILHPYFLKEDLKDKEVLTTGLPASPGAVYGQICIHTDKIEEFKKDGNVILLREETSPEDIEAMNISDGILTIRGGMTSHAAVVARAIGTPCISGANNIKINFKTKEIMINKSKFKEGDYISLDATNGDVYGGKIIPTPAEMFHEFEEVINIAKKNKKLKVYANADTGYDYEKALDFGAESIGLVRTEHMFFGEEKIFHFRKLILEDNKENKEKVLDELQKIQTKDFEEIFSKGNNQEITIRYLDPPLHEFLPKEDNLIKELADDLKIKEEDLKIKIKELEEVNPMLGHRGVRLLISFPEIIRMQTNAILDAMINTKTNNALNIMIPLVSDTNEFLYVKKQIEEVIAEYGNSINKDNIKIGTMLETPRAILTIDSLVQHVDFVSFGTNDLTQMTYGFSRDDIPKFISEYNQKGIMDMDPFEKLDEDGVGKLIKYAVQNIKEYNPNISIGICGEQAANYQSIKFLNNLNINYISCSTYFIPIGIIAASQLYLNENN